MDPLFWLLVPEVIIKSEADTSILPSDLYLI